MLLHFNIFLSMLQCLGIKAFNVVLFYFICHSVLWCSELSVPVKRNFSTVLSIERGRETTTMVKGIRGLSGTDYFRKPRQSHLSFPSSRRAKRTVRKQLGERCATFDECPSIALCVGGVCSCPYDYYNYVSPSQQELVICRKKVKFGHFCTLTEDCQGYDANSACFEGICKCINGTQYIGSRNLLAHDRKCYKTLEREGDECEIDEQCSRLAYHQHKCRCLGRCDCAIVDRYGGCTICHENIKRTFFGGAAFIIILLTSRLFSRMRHHSGSNQRQQSTLEVRRLSSGGRCSRLNTSNTVPSVSYNRGSLQHSRRVAASLPDVFLIDSHRLLPIPSSHTTHFLPQTSQCVADTVSGRSEDSPPSYDDIVESDQIIWNEPPPAYEDVAHKGPLLPRP